MHLDQASPEQLKDLLSQLETQYSSFQEAKLSLNLTRGKPSAEQLDLANGLYTAISENAPDKNGTDIRNYGGLRGIPEMREFFAEMIDVKAENILVGDNASLSLMYQSVHTGLDFGFNGPESAWKNEAETPKFIAPVPGYDRHFAVCERLGVELIPVAMDNNGPDMDEVERLIKADPSIKGIWCVPRFSNPTGVVYSDEVVDRFAQLGKIAPANFRIFWDNAYAVHIVEQNAATLKNILTACQAAGTEDSVLIFGSTSKITFAGAGVAFVAASENNLKAIEKTRSYITIGPDKVNQLCHVKFLKDKAGLTAHMDKHAALLKPRFDAVLDILFDQLANTGMAVWTEPQGGYFISLDTLPGLANEVVKLAADAGVALTPAGATFPYGKDIKDTNIRIAPSFPSVDDIKEATKVLCCCIKLASVKQRLAHSG